jgi:hypothetical protein
LCRSYDHPTTRAGPKLPANGIVRAASGFAEANVHDNACRASEIPARPPSSRTHHERVSHSPRVGTALVETRPRGVDVLGRSDNVPAAALILGRVASLVDSAISVAATLGRQIADRPSSGRQEDEPCGSSYSLVPREPQRIGGGAPSRARHGSSLAGDDGGLCPDRSLQRVQRVILAAEHRARRSGCDRRLGRARSESRGCARAGPGPADRHRPGELRRGGAARGKARARRVRAGNRRRNLGRRSGVSRRVSDRERPLNRRPAVEFHRALDHPPLGVLIRDVDRHDRCEHAERPGRAIRLLAVKMSGISTRAPSATKRVARPSPITDAPAVTSAIWPSHPTQCCPPRRPPVTSAGSSGQMFGVWSFAAHIAQPNGTCLRDHVNPVSQSRTATRIGAPGTTYPPY